MAIASFIVGLIAIFTSWLPGFGFLFSISAFIVAIIAAASKDTKPEHSGYKIAGLVLSIISTIISVVIILLIAVGFKFIFNTVENVGNMVENIKPTEKTEVLIDSLLDEYFEIKADYMFSKEDDEVKKNQALERYMDILKNEYSELYAEGYRVEVEDNLMFKILEPLMDSESVEVM